MEIVLVVSGIQQSMKESLALTTLHLAKQLTVTGNHVTVISRNKWNQPSSEVVDGVSFVRTKSLWKFPLYNKLLAFPFAVRKLAGKRIDVIHSFSASPVLVLRSLIAKLYARNALVVHTLKSYPIKKDIKAKSGSFFLSRLSDSFYRLLNYADFVTVPTETYARKLTEKGVDKKKIKVIYSFIDLHTFFPQNKEKLKKKYGYQSKKIIFHYGSMWEIKGTDYLINSLPLIIKHVPNVKVVLAPRNQEQALEKYMPLITKLDIEKHVEFILHDVKIEDYVNLADVVVLPYPHLEGTEGNPSCLLEALACKTPVVSTELPELKELFSDCAVLVKPADARALARAVISVLKGNNSQRVEKGLESVKKFGIDSITEQFLSLYHK